MAILTTALAGAFLAVPVAAGSIKPSFEALTWKFNEQDFWAPVHLDSVVYHAQSPAGVIGDSLAKRNAPLSGHISCTIVTISGSAQSLSGAVMEEALSGYESDDVWSAEQFMDCILIQYNGTGSGIGIDSTLGDFIADKAVRTAYFDVAFDLTGLVTAASVFSLVTNCELNNGPHVITLPDCESGTMSVTPVYSLHSDNYDGTRA
jgi:hypothetical protein